ncbi:hypothetical protein GA0115235_110643 [Streptomyces sp. DpondAA-F4a]|nr:hypothetical protein GA0115235_110643 [Streptomyces sp. DpondAA-F4a]
MTERSAVPPEEPGGSPRTDPRLTARGGRPISRKSLLRAAVAASAVPLVAGGGAALARDTGAGAVPLAPTPACDDGDDPTPTRWRAPTSNPTPRRAPAW